jgi:hypothetical protein
MKFAEGSVTSSGFEVVVAAGSGGSALHRTTMIVRAAPPTRNTTTLEAISPRVERGENRVEEDRVENVDFNRAGRRSAASC